MDQLLPVMMQGGSLGILAYLVWWVTQVGAPKLWESATRISSSIESNTSKLSDVERGQAAQLAILTQLVKNQTAIGDEALRELKSHKS